MATAFGSAAGAAFYRIPRAERSCGPRKTTRLHCVTAQTGFASHETYAPLALRLAAHASGAGPQDRPPRAPGLYSRRGPAARGVASDQGRAAGGAPRWCLQSCAWAGCGANEAQAPAAGEAATQRGLRERAKRADRAGRTFHGSRILFEPERSAGELIRAGRGLARRRGFGESRAAALPNAVAIAPQPAHAQLCREVYARAVIGV